MALLTVVAIAFPGCKSGSFPSGHFQGTLLERAGSSITQQPVASDIVFHGSSAAEIDVKDLHQQTVLTISISNLSEQSLSILVPGITPQNITLTKSSGCYEERSGDSLRVCLETTRFVIETFSSDGSPLFALTGDQFAPEGQYQYEAPQSYSLSDAINIALKKNFDTRIEFERVMQAKLTARASFEDLLPHLSVSSILNNLAPSWETLLQSIGDLAPFLIPTRWLQAEEATVQAKAEADTLVLMQADSAVQVEGLAYSLKKDEAVIGIYRYLIGRTTQARDLSADLEKAGTFPVGSADHLTEQLDSMQLDVSALQELVEEDKAALAQAMGLNNPEAVTELAIGPESVAWENATPLDAKSTANIALSRSFELDQMDDLIEIANKQKKALYFNWLDPAGDPTANLGINLSDQVQVASSQIDSLLTQREQLQQIITQTVFTAVDEYNESASEYAQIQSAMTLNESRLDRDIAQLTPDSSLNTLDIEGIVQDYLEMGIRQENSRSTFRIARSKIDRSLLQGAYVHAQVLR